MPSDERRFRKRPAIALLRGAGTKQASTSHYASFRALMSTLQSGGIGALWLQFQFRELRRPTGLVFSALVVKEIGQSSNAESKSDNKGKIQPHDQAD
jgi:hypothetical protein